MAIPTKSSLKEVFSGLSSCYIVKNGISSFNSITADFDLPVTVDSLSFTQAEPTLNSTKVHGLNADWCSVAEAGDITFSATVPSVSSTLCDYFLGTGTAVTTGTGTDNIATGFSGKSYSLTTNKLYMGLALLSDDGTHLCVIKKIAVYATPNFENASSTPFSFTLTGSIEASDDTSEDNIAFLTKA